MLGPLGTAQAVSRPSMVAKPDESTTETFPPLLASAPTSGTVDLDPDTCAKPEVLFCDTVAIDVLAAGDVSVEVGWSDLDAGTNDVDIILYGAGSGGQYPKLGASESSSRPERVTSRVGKGLIHLVVVNWAGANNGYSVETNVATSSGPPPPATVGVQKPKDATPPASPGATSPPRRAVTSNRAATAKAAPSTPAGNSPAAPETPAATAQLPTNVAATPTDANYGSDIGYLAWLAAAIFPVLLGIVLVRTRRSGADTAL